MGPVLETLRACVPSVLLPLSFVNESVFMAAPLGFAFCLATSHFLAAFVAELSDSLNVERLCPAVESID